MIEVMIICPPGGSDTKNNKKKMKRVNCRKLATSLDNTACRPCYVPSTHPLLYTSREKAHKNESALLNGIVHTRKLQETKDRGSPPGENHSSEDSQYVRFFWWQPTEGPQTARTLWKAMMQCEESGMEHSV